MQSSTQRDLVVIAGSLLGITLSRLIDDRGDDGSPVESSGDDHSKAMVAALPSLIAAVSVTHRIGRVLDIPPSNLAAYGGLSLAAGAVIGHFAGTLAQFMPTLRSRDVFEG
jgi:hypothetical protein